nr:reverse transcriptase domain-containing protein [Tanacetum cinerariifolium]
MKLNPKNYTFRVKEEMFLGYTVNTKGLKVCPDKVDVVLSLPSPIRLKDVQKLNGKLANLDRQVPRSENKKDDALSKMASTCFAHLSKQVSMEEIKEKSIREVEILAVVEEEGDTWMTSIFKYLEEGTLPANMKKARAVRHARTLIRACQDCQVHKPVLRNPQQKLTPITSLWPFYKWGIDIARPFPEGPEKVKFFIVAIDYFTKWIEAKPVATITGNQIKKFMWDNIVCRFGLPGEIILGNGKQFRVDPFKDWCKKLCIRQYFASVKLPQTNGLVERANRSLGEGIKARLDARSKNWIEELPHVLWAHCTMIKSSNRDTPFSLTYKMEAVIPAEIGMPTLKTAEVDLVQNNEALAINLDLLEERRERKQQYVKLRVKQKWKNTITQKSEIQVSNQEILYTATTMQAGRKT